MYNSISNCISFEELDGIFGQDCYAIFNYCYFDFDMDISLGLSFQEIKQKYLDVLKSRITGNLRNYKSGVNYVINEASITLSENFNKTTNYIFWSLCFERDMSSIHGFRFMNHPGWHRYEI